MDQNYGDGPFDDSSEPKYSSVPYEPPPGADSDDLNLPPITSSSQVYSSFPDHTPRKKRKLWLWITLAITIPLFFCCLGIGGCTYLVFNSERPAFDVTNDFYAALRDGENPNPYLCRALRTSSSFYELLDEYETMYGEVESFNFDSFESINGSTDITGVVNRSTRDSLDAKVSIVTEDGEEKVCDVTEVILTQGFD